MTRRPETYIYDALQAANAIEAFVVGQGYADYQESALLRSAVERQFEIIGEALNRLKQLDAGCSRAFEAAVRPVACATF